MTTAQKTIAICNILPVALFLHVLYCDWDAGDVYTGNSYESDGSYKHALVPLGSTVGIVARSEDSVAFDGLLGIAIPFMLVGAALFVIVSPRGDVRKTESGD